MVITLNKEIIALCFSFAEQAWNGESQSQRHFGGEERTKNQFIADQVEGKLAEHIFLDFLKSKGVNAKLDMNHYAGKKNTDKGDLIIQDGDKTYRVAVDIKGTSIYSQSLLVENYKFYKDESCDHQSDYYILIKFDHKFIGNKAFRDNPYQISSAHSISGFCAGWARSEEFYDADNKLWFKWVKGKRPLHQGSLPNIKPNTRIDLARFLNTHIKLRKEKGYPIEISIPLDADLNYGLPVKWLNNNWGKLIIDIQETKSQI